MGRPGGRRRSVPSSPRLALFYILSASPRSGDTLGCFAPPLPSLCPPLSYSLFPGLALPLSPHGMGKAHYLGAWGGGLDYVI